MHQLKVKKSDDLDFIQRLDLKNLLKPLEELKNCKICPRNCGVNRFSKKLGYCNSDACFNIASICIHKGEEPVISGKNGICNIFFSRCNMQCIYCQNYQISRNKEEIIENKLELKEVIEKIKVILDFGCKAVGFVSPSHFIPHVKVIINALHSLGIKPIIVYNSNAYDKVEKLKELEGMIDVYLPDFKYMDKKLAKDYSDAYNYPEIASKAIKEMYRQKGSTLIINDDGQAESGLIIRHLVLPNHIDNSIKVLKYIAKEISTSVHISLMSQYYPTKNVANHPDLGRTLSTDEYKKVINQMKSLGFYKGWLQQLDSSEYYNPDFVEENPFEKY